MRQFDRMLPGTMGAWLFMAAASIWIAFPCDFFSLPPLVLLWPLGLALGARQAATPKQAFLAGWAATALGMIAALYWLALPLAQVGGLAWPVAFLCAVLIAMLLAAQGGLFCLLAHRLSALPVWRNSACLALAWYLLEYAFAVTIGFPWLPLAGALAQWPVLIQGASIFGAYFLGALWLFCALLLAGASDRRLAPMSRILYALYAFTAISCLLWYGTFQLAIQPAQQGAGVDCVMAQGNVDQNQKWTPPFQLESLERYLRLTDAGITRARLAGMNNPLLIWPETAMPFFYERNNYLGRRIRAAVADWNCPLLFGAPGVGRSAEMVFNRAFLLGPAGETLGVYDKVHLVPFGEYLPDWLNWGFLRNLLQGVGIYEEGESINSLNYGPLALGVLICYEGIFPWLAHDRVTGGANILADISNDGWFGRTPAARQHLYLTLLRCVEQNRWLLRATNTGISAVSDNRGRVIQMGTVFQEEYLVCRAALESGRSPFYFLSPLLPWLAFALFCILAAGRSLKPVVR